MKNNQELVRNSPNFMSPTLYLVFQPRIVSSIFTFFSILVESYFLSSYFSAVLFYFLPLLCFFSPSTSKFKVLEGQFKRMEVFFSPILNKDMGFSSVQSSDSKCLASVLSWILLLRYYSVWFRLLMKSLIEWGSDDLNYLSRFRDLEILSKVLGGLSCLLEVTAPETFIFLHETISLRLLIS